MKITNSSIYNISIAEPEDKNSNHVKQVLSMLNKGYANTAKFDKNKHIIRKIRQLMPRGTTPIKMHPLGYKQL